MDNPRKNLVVRGSEIEEIIRNSPKRISMYNVHCLACGIVCNLETWNHQSSLKIISIPKNYTRVIFAVHPDIWHKHKCVPAVFTTVYFCKDCAKLFNLRELLLSAIAECNPPGKWIAGNNSPFDKTRGCWITAWFTEKESDPPLNIQVDISMFRKIIEKLTDVLGNPFQIAEK